MNKIKQLLRLHLEGISNRKIASELGMNKETVNNYVIRAKTDSMGIEELLKLEDPVLEHRMSGGNPAYVDERFEAFKRQLPYLQKEMGRKHVTLKLLWEEYKAECPEGYSLTQFRFHYNQNIQAQKPTTVLHGTYVGGEKLFIDFAGDRMEYVDTQTGEVVKPQMFVACLPASDYGFALAVPSQRSEDFVYAIIKCLKAIGGVPKIIVPDNLKSAVTKTHPYEPDINKILEDMANHYGCVVLPARPGKPRDKHLVEDHVHLVYQRVYAELRNERFYSLGDLNRAVEAKMQAHNRKRMQLHPYSREEHFLAIEKPELRPLPATDFEIQSYGSHKVGLNGCILLGRDKHHYSVPYKHIGRQVQVIYTRTLVKVYADGECIATHIRNYTAGKYTLVREHMASHSLAYRDRSPEYYIARGKKATEALGLVIQGMFASSKVPPETFYRSCEGLLHLQRSTDPILFERVCEASLLHGDYRYSFIQRLIETKCKGLENLRFGDGDVQAPPMHENIRGKDAFQ